MAHRGGAERGGGGVMGGSAEQFQGDTLQAGTCDPLQIEQAMALIDRHARHEDDRQLLIDAVFGTPRKARKHGDKPSPEWARARTAWLERCRDWVEAKAGRVLGTAQIPDSDQHAYEVATGDVWVSPDPARSDAGGRETRYRYPVPAGEIGGAYRSRVRAWGREQGWKVCARGPIEVWLLNRYVDATGDAYVEPAPKPSALVPVGPARAHLERLLAAGVSQEAIAAAVPMSIGAVNMVLRGRSGRSLQARIRATTEARVLALKAPCEVAA
jgi:hypothetical protein